MENQAIGKSLPHCQARAQCDLSARRRSSAQRAPDAARGERDEGRHGRCARDPESRRGLLPGYTVCNNNGYSFRPQQFIVQVPI